MNRPSDHALWTSVIETLRTTIAPHVDEAYAALQTQRLIALALYARDRGGDPTDHRLAEVGALIGDDDPTSVLVDVDDPRRPDLQRILMDHLDADLATERVLLEHFGQRPEPDPLPDPSPKAAGLTPGLDQHIDHDA